MKNWKFEYQWYFKKIPCQIRWGCMKTERIRQYVPHLCKILGITSSEKKRYMLQKWQQCRERPEVPWLGEESICYWQELKYMCSEVLNLLLIFYELNRAFYSQSKNQWPVELFKQQCFTYLFSEGRSGNWANSCLHQDQGMFTRTEA